MKQIPCNYGIQSDWKGDTESAALIADNLSNTLIELSKIGKMMSNWRLLDFGAYQAIPIYALPSTLLEFVEQSMQRNDHGKPEPKDGYQLLAIGEENVSDFGSSKTVTVSINAGSTWNNDIAFDIGSVNRPSDLSLVSYPTYRRSLEALVSNWPCPWAVANAFYVDYDKEPKGDVPAFPYSKFHMPWIAYLSAPLVAGLTPPPDLTWERTPAGGLILGAVEDRLDVENPDHMRRSRVLLATLLDRIGDARSQSSWGPRIGPC